MSLRFSRRVSQTPTPHAPKERPKPSTRSLNAWQLMQLFDKFGMQSKGVVYKRGMENMLGKQLWLSSGPTCIM